MKTSSRCGHPGDPPTSFLPESRKALPALPRPASQHCAFCKGCFRQVQDFLRLLCRGSAPTTHASDYRGPKHRKNHCATLVQSVAEYLLRQFAAQNTSKIILPRLYKVWQNTFCPSLLPKTPQKSCCHACTKCGRIPSAPICCPKHLKNHVATLVQSVAAYLLRQVAAQNTSKIMLPRLYKVWQHTFCAKLLPKTPQKSCCHACTKCGRIPSAPICCPKHLKNHVATLVQSVAAYLLRQFNAQNTSRIILPRLYKVWQNTF